MLKIHDGFSGERSLILPKFIIEEFQKDSFGKQLYITDIGFYPSAKYHFRERKEGADQYILIYCRQGSGWFWHEGVRYEVGQEQFFIIPAKDPHSYGASVDQPWTIYWLHFSGSFAPVYADGYARPTSLYSDYNLKTSDLVNDFEQIYGTLKKGYSKSNIQYAMSRLYSFLATITYMSVCRGESTEHESDIIEHAIHYMNENIEKKLNIKDLTKYLGCQSSSTLSSQFKHRTGYSLLSYFNHLKIQEACNCLDYTDMSVSQISAKIGIEDPYYFSRLFTIIMGMSPTKYRNSVKG
ncbi:MAG: AraC family transcriptional regulator [Rikenellaceae bacterium]